jgi:RepB plasmid partitioning protein/ParB/Sulfiredoxin domain
MNMTNNQIPIAFADRIITVRLENILPLRKLDFDPKEHRMYQRILASIRQIKLIEPLAVYPVKGSDGKYTLLDGHLRLHALKEIGAQDAKCLIATADEAFTYNHKVSRVAPIQEHFMLMKALSNGVSEDRIAQTLNVDIAAIRQKRDLLVGICDEAVELLKDKKASAGALREIRKVKPLRQIEMAELMIASHNYSATYAAILLAATPPEQLLDSEKPKEIRGLRPEDMDRMEKEMEKISEDFRMIEETHGRNVLNLVLASSATFFL